MVAIEIEARQASSCKPLVQGSVSRCKQTHDSGAELMLKNEILHGKILALRGQQEMVFFLTLGGKPLMQKKSNVHQGNAVGMTTSGE